VGPVAGGFYGTAPVLFDLRIDQLSEMCLEAFVRPFLVRAHQSRIARDIGGENRGETAFDALLHASPSRAILEQNRYASAEE